MAPRTCPVCGEEVEDYAGHLSSHSKEDVVATLLRQHESNPPPTTSAFGYSSQAGQGVQLVTYTRAVTPGASQGVTLASNSSSSSSGLAGPSQATLQIRKSQNNVNIVNNIGTNFVSTSTSSGGSGAATQVVVGQQTVGLVNPLTMMQGLMPVSMMGGGLASTPLLLPQVNGPTLLVNVPNYMGVQAGYPQHTSIQGLVLPGLLGQQVASVPQVILPSAPLVTSSPTLLTTTTPATLPVVVSSSQPVVTVCQPVASSPVDRHSLLSPLSPEPTKAGPSRRRSSTPKHFSDKGEEEMEVSESEDEGEYIEEVEETKELQLDPTTLLPEEATVSPLTSPRQLSVISHAPPVSSSAAPAVRTDACRQVQDSLLGGQQQEEEESALIPPSTSPSLTPIDTHLPTLTLNFPNILMMDSSATVPSPNSASSPSSVIVSSSSPITPPARSSPPPLPQSSPTPASISLAGQQPITVDTVEALQSALACDNDVQLVVSNELLETPEFKALMQHMDQSSNMSSMENTPAVSPTPLSRRPGQILEESNPPSPVPCSSRETTRQGFDTSTDSLGLSLGAGEEDDITLQDLIAVETIDESQMAEDDLPWPSQLQFDNFQYISQVMAGSVLACDRCGLAFNSLEDHRTHAASCKERKPKKSTSKTKGLKKVVSTVTSENEVVKELLINDEKLLVNRVKHEPGLWVEDELSRRVAEEAEDDDLKPMADLKQEPSVASQNPLGAQSKHWKCGPCKMVFETGPQLLDHLDAIKRSKIKCVACHLIYDDRKDLIAHRRKDHPADLLRLKFDPESEPKDEPMVLDEKMYEANAIGEYVCDTCDRAFKDKELLIKHLSCHMETKPHECLECGKKFTKPNLLREHKKRHFEDGTFQCNYCNKKFFTPNKLREHIRIHTGEAPLKCNICGKGFKRHSNLSEHKKIHEPNREVKPQKELFCHCGKVFKTQRDLDWHKEGEHDKQPKKCTFCLEVFVHSSSLTRHIRQKHEGSFMPEGKKTSLYARCPICSQVFYKTSINKHIRVKHHGQKPYSCDICKKQFVAKCNLVNHMWQHKNQRQRPFKCTQCKKAYLREALLEQHMRSHRGVKPFVCNECGLQFTVKSNWQRHVSEHTGTRNYECEHCHKKFSRSYYLTDHLKVTHSRR